MGMVKRGRGRGEGEDEDGKRIGVCEKGKGEWRKD